MGYRIWSIDHKRCYILISVITCPHTGFSFMFILLQCHVQTRFIDCLELLWQLFRFFIHEILCWLNIMTSQWHWMINWIATECFTDGFVPLGVPHEVIVHSHIKATVVFIHAYCWADLFCFDKWNLVCYGLILNSPSFGLLQTLAHGGVLMHLCNHAIWLVDQA